jgi:branched-chain amino acid transport system substrate-binding protein
MALSLALVSSGVAVATSSGAAVKKPIIVGAVIDETNTMKPFDLPALQAAKIYVDQLNATGGVGGRKIVFKVWNDQLKPTLTRSDALAAIAAGANVLWVSCDVNYATPAIQVGLAAKVLTVAPCIGTDQMGPSLFGSAGKLAFSFGNAPQSDGAVLARLLINHGWKTAAVVTDKLLAYFVTACQDFSSAFVKDGGQIVSQSSFTSFDGTAAAVAGNVATSGADATVLCATTTPDLPTFVTALRTLGNTKPLVGLWSMDGGFWEPTSLTVSNNIWWATFASVFGDDPSTPVRALEAKMAAKGETPLTGGFVTGPSAVQGIVLAIQRNHGNLNGTKLAAIMAKFHNVSTISGSVSFTPTQHTVVGRSYRIIEVTNGKPHFVQMLSPGPLGS